MYPLSPQRVFNLYGNSSNNKSKLTVIAFVFDSNTNGQITKRQPPGQKLSRKGKLQFKAQNDAALSSCAAAPHQQCPDLWLSTAR